MRFRIKKNNDGSIYTILVAGEMDDDGSWDVLQVAQTMLGMPHCKELIIDLQAAIVDEDFSVFNSDTLVAVFEEGLLKKDCTLTIRFNETEEVRFTSDQLPLEIPPVFTSVTIDEAKFFGKAMKWLGQEARLLVN